MEKLIIASADSHATMPPTLWPQYLEKEFHRYLPRLLQESELFGSSMRLLNDMLLSPQVVSVFDSEHVYRSGQWNGVWDQDIRLQEMDREGVATEMVFPGDMRAMDLFFGSPNSNYAPPVMDAGARAYNRWCHDTFGAAKERLLLIGAPLSGIDIDAMIKEAHWMADHGFTGVFTPNYCAVPEQIPLFDAYWDPLWRAYAERKLVLITHAGWGIPQGYLHGEVEAAAAAVKAEHGDDNSMRMKLWSGVFNDKGVFSDLRSRKVIWQLMLGGVFDRHPKLKLMETEIRADWIPATLTLLDHTWEENRQAVAAKRRPSEYWRTHCMAGLSFMNKTEVAMRHELGVETMAFGRDYPHTEATWPNSLAYFSDIFRGVPEQEVRGVLGENLIRFLGLDRAKLAAIAERIGPSYKQVAEGPGLSPELLAHLNLRCGYSNPCEGGERLAELEVLLRRDLPHITAAQLMAHAA